MSPSCSSMWICKIVTTAASRKSGCGSGAYITSTPNLRPGTCTIFGLRKKSANLSASRVADMTITCEKNEKRVQQSREVLAGCGLSGSQGNWDRTLSGLSDPLLCFCKRFTSPKRTCSRTNCSKFARVLRPTRSAPQTSDAVLVMTANGHTQTGRI
eukprot:3596725-Rhodomonas_salina.1